MATGNVPARQVPAIRETLRLLCATGLRIPGAQSAPELAARHEHAAAAMRQRVERLLARLDHLDPE